MESFQSMLFRYTTSGILSNHFDSQQDMIQCINDDMQRINGGESAESVVSGRHKEMGVFTKSLDNESYREDKIFRKSTSAGVIVSSDSLSNNVDECPESIILNALWTGPPVNILESTAPTTKLDVRKNRKTLRSIILKRLNFI